jgi:hypothetical protein
MTPTISSDIRAAANRALIAGSAEYFSGTADEQEEFRATAGKEARCRMQRVLLKQVLGIECSAADASETWRELSLHQLNDINPADLLISGIGDDFVYLNESLHKGVSLLDFETLYDYDFDDFLFQEEWRHKDLKDYVSPGYLPLYHSRWIRLVMDDKFVYGNLFSVASYVVSQVAEAGDCRLDELIPSSYVEGPNHGKPQNGGVIWDHQLDADGQEPQLEELRRRWWQHQRDAEHALQRELADAPPHAYILQDESPVPGEVNVNFVIQNEKAMRKVFWRTFLADLRAIEGNTKDVENLIKREVNSGLRFIAEQYQDIQANYVAPDIMPGKERKLVISSGALDDLDRLSREDSKDD